MRKSILFVMAAACMQSAAAPSPKLSPAGPAAESPQDCSDRLAYGSLAVERQQVGSRIRGYFSSAETSVGPVLNALVPLILKRIQKLLPRHKRAEDEKALIHEISVRLILELGDHREYYLLNTKRMNEEEEASWKRIYAKDLGEYLESLPSRMDNLIKRLVEAHFAGKPERTFITVPHPVTGVDEFLPTESLRHAMRTALTEREQKVIEAIYFEDVRLAELAWEMDLGSEKVRQILKDALRKLRATLDRRHGR